MVLWLRSNIMKTNVRFILNLLILNFPALFSVSSVAFLLLTYKFWSAKCMELFKILNNTKAARTTCSHRVQRPIIDISLQFHIKIYTTRKVLWCHISKRRSRSIILRICQNFVDWSRPKWIVSSLSLQLLWLLNHHILTIAYNSQWTLDSL